DLGLAHAPAEERDLCGRQLARAPLPGRLGENLERLAAAGLGTVDGAGQAARNGEMCAKSRHGYTGRISFRSMRKILPIALVALALSAVRPAHLDAWGFSGHKFITERAIDLLPAEIRPFLVKFKTPVVEPSIDPDTYRTMGWLEEPPRHFLDMDAYGPFPFKDLPHDYAEAVAKRGADFVTKNGTVPWRAQEVYVQLRDAFKQLPTQGYARDN